MDKGAALSPCGKYRHLLARTWDSNLPTLAFVMLNPSTADASEDDPTIRKCIGFATRLGYGAIAVVNLSDFRATDPKRLAAAGYPIHNECDSWIRGALNRADDVICAWGRHAAGMQHRVTTVMAIVLDSGHVPKALRMNADGSPAHPLMLPYSCTPMEMTL